MRRTRAALSGTAWLRSARARSLVRRFYLDPSAFAEPLVQLGGDQARRLGTVLRLKAGAEISVFDGLGRERRATIQDVRRGLVTLALGEPVEPLPELPVPVVLCAAFPRGGRGDWLVEKATELGVAALVPLEADRSVMLPGDGRIERWRRIAIEAAEQSGRATVPPFTSEVPRDALPLVADLGAEATPHQVLATATAVAARSLALYVGPEGGWTPEERERHLMEGAIFVSLGPRPLRIETAAVTLLALVGDALRSARPGRDR